MKIAVLGRQPEFGVAELQAVLGADGKTVQLLTPEVAEFDGPSLDINRLGSIKKLGLTLFTTSRAKIAFDLKKYVQKSLIPALAQTDERHKVTIGISAYANSISAKDAFNLGVTVKKALRARDVSVRLVPNTEPELSTAQSFHNGLGSSLYKIELLIIGQNDRFTVAQSTGVQNPDAYAARDQKRPKRDAFVGMLPPKLAQTMVNLALGNRAADPQRLRLLDPFCGTGTILQEAALSGAKIYGTDLSPKMIDYSRANLEWLSLTAKTTPETTLEIGDARRHKWQPPIDAVASEIYLGSPLSNPPGFEKLRVLRRNAEELLEEFLKNLSPQLKPGTRLCLAVPAWRRDTDGFSRLNLDFLERLEYNVEGKSRDLLYAREQQIVARDLIILVKK
jgi:tRNA G10  N-methylase Trm11